MSTDLFITAALCFYLFRSRNGHKGYALESSFGFIGAWPEQSHFVRHRTNSVINTLCIYTINTGLLTTWVVSASTINLIHCAEYLLQTLESGLSCCCVFDQLTLVWQWLIFIYSMHANPSRSSSWHFTCQNPNVRRHPFRLCWRLKFYSVYVNAFLAS